MMRDGFAGNEAGQLILVLIIMNAKPDNQRYFCVAVAGGSALSCRIACWMLSHTAGLGS
jgi:hypothetical protein